MSECIDEGVLRAYLLDRDAIPDGENLRARVEAHLPGCPACREQLASLRNLSARISRQMATLAPDTPASNRGALSRLQERLGREGVRGSVSGEPGVTSRLPQILQPDSYRRPNMQTIANPNVRFGMRRAIFSGLAAILILCFVTFPSIRAAADQLLQTFRATSNKFVEVTASRLQQLQAMNFDTSTLFLSSPHFASGSLKETPVATINEATNLAGFTPEQVGTLPGAPLGQGVAVYGKSSLNFTLNVDSLRNVLAALNINDIALPDALGTQPINAMIPPAVVTEYKGVGYSFSLYQGRSPEVNLPAGVDMAELGRAGLRVLGMEPAEADILSKQIDWRSTLVVPFPTGLSDIKQVRVGSVSGLLVQASTVDSPGTRLGSKASSGHTLLYWQRGDHFYVLDGVGSGADESALLAAAESVK